MFNNQNNNAGGGIFNNNNQNQGNAGGGIFNNQQQQQQPQNQNQTGGIFNNQPQNQTGGIFNNQPQQNNNMFQNQNNNVQGGNIFQNQNNQQQQPQQQMQQQQQVPFNNLLGNNNQQQNIFQNNNNMMNQQNNNGMMNQNQQQGGLFQNQNLMQNQNQMNNNLNEQQIKEKQLQEQISKNIENYSLSYMQESKHDGFNQELQRIFANPQYENIGDKSFFEQNNSYVNGTSLTDLLTNNVYIGWKIERISQAYQKSRENAPQQQQQNNNQQGGMFMQQNNNLMGGKQQNTQSKDLKAIWEKLVSVNRIMARIQDKDLYIKPIKDEKQIQQKQTSNNKQTTQCIVWSTLYRNLITGNSPNQDQIKKEQWSIMFKHQQNCLKNNFGSYFDFQSKQQGNCLTPFQSVFKKRIEELIETQISKNYLQNKMQELGQQKMIILEGALKQIIQFKENSVKINQQNSQIQIAINYLSDCKPMLDNSRYDHQRIAQNHTSIQRELPNPNIIKYISNQVCPKIIQLENRLLEIEIITKKRINENDIELNDQDIIDNEPMEMVESLDSLIDYLQILGGNQVAIHNALEDHIIHDRIIVKRKLGDTNKEFLVKIKVVETEIEHAMQIRKRNDELRNQTTSF